MCTLDDIESNEFILPTTEVKEEHLDCTGDYCMSIEIHNVNIEDENELNRRIEFVCRNELFSCDLTSKGKCIFFKSKSGKKSLHYHLLANALCKCAKIKGDCDSFAIVKFYKRNCLSDGVKPIYEDFVTPEYSMDIAKLESFLKEIVNNK